jgi:hypothetical protein
MTRKRLLTRREFLGLAAGAATGALLTACAQPQPAPAPAAQPAATAAPAKAAEPTKTPAATAAPAAPAATSEKKEAPTQEPTPVPFNCATNEAKSLVCTAPKEGVIVTVPQQKSEVRVENLPWGDTAELYKPDRNGWFAARVVINFQIVDIKTSKVLDAFDPPLNIQVPITEQDRKAVKNELTNLRMGFFDHDKHYWVLFETTKHQVSFNDKYFIIGRFPSWGDRHMAYLAQPE